MSGCLPVAVLGPGGVGGLLAALLARAGVDVVVLAGGRTVRQIAERGLRLESKRFGDFQVRLRSTPQLEEPVRACMITVKATQLGSRWGACLSTCAKRHEWYRFSMASITWN